MMTMMMFLSHKHHGHYGTFSESTSKTITVTAVLSDKAGNWIKMNTFCLWINFELINLC